MDPWLDQLPPWKAFPELQPLQVAARQGLQEAWVDQVWRPFWGSLSASQREAYFEHWQASTDWRDAIRATFEPEPGFDAEADLADSQRHLAERSRSAAMAQPSGWRRQLARLFGKR